MDGEIVPVEEGKNPLVTVILFTYNQEVYVAEAVGSILDQSYQPLEIIISDDCSSDATFCIVEEMEKKYSGPHLLRINQNAENQGIGRHVSNLMKEAKGALVVMSAGDDVSMPDRVDVIVKEWEKGGRPAGICSDVTMIDPAGVEVAHREGFCGAGGVDVGTGVKRATLDAYHRRSGFCLLGCSAAWSPSVLEVFGKLADGVMNEDSAFTLRALLLGDVLSVNRNLVKYRVHGGNVWAKESRPRAMTITERRGHEEMAVRKAEFRVSLCRLSLADLEVALEKDLLPQRRFDDLTKSLEVEYVKARTSAQWWTYGPVDRVRYFTKLGGGMGTKLLKLLPLEAFLVIKNVFS